ncbi:response regulator transcription factor, partial [Chloroflexota bacterium]
MKTKIRSTILTNREREVLILGAEHLKQLSNIEIAQQLGISVSSVKMIIHSACIKLGASTRNEAILIALKRGEIGLNDLFSLDEMAERFKFLGPNMLRRIAYLVSQGIDYRYFSENDEQIAHTYIRRDALLTKTERDVLILSGCGLTNRKIADRLCISVSSVGTFIYRARTKLGAHRRADVVVSAVEQGEINACDIFSPDELVQMFAPLGTEFIEKVAQLVEQKFGQKPVP